MTPRLRNLRLFRAFRKERQRLAERGATVRRVRLDAELKSAVARGSEAVRLKHGRQAAAGFAMHANGPAAAGLLRKLGLGGSEKGSWLKGPVDRDPASVEL